MPGAGANGVPEDGRQKMSHVSEATIGVPTPRHPRVGAETSSSPEPAPASVLLERCHSSEQSITSIRTGRERVTVGPHLQAEPLQSLGPHHAKATQHNDQTPAVPESAGGVPTSAPHSAAWHTHAGLRPPSPPRTRRGWNRLRPPVALQVQGLVTAWDVPEQPQPHTQPETGETPPCPRAA